MSTSYKASLHHTSKSPTKHTASRIDHAVQTMTAILREENVALSAMDFARAGALLAPKHAAAEDLADAWRSADAEPSGEDNLIELGRLAEENRVLLNRAMRVQKRVLELVARAAKAAQPASGYGAAGRPRNSAIAPQSLKIRM